MLNACVCINANPIGVKPVNVFSQNALELGLINMLFWSRRNHHPDIPHNHEPLMRSPFESHGWFGLNASTISTTERYGATSTAEGEYPQRWMKCCGMQEWKSANCVRPPPFTVLQSNLEALKKVRCTYRLRRRWQKVGVFPTSRKSESQRH